MIKKVSKNEMRKVRHERIRENLSGTSERPRLCVFRSNANIEAQIIDDVKGVTLVSATTLEKDLKIKNGGNVEAAKVIGAEIAKRAKKAKINTVVFDTERENEDEFIAHRLIFEVKNKIVVSNQKLYFYRIHKNSRQRTFNKKKLELLEVFDEREKYFPQDKELIIKNRMAKIDMILLLYSVCKINKQKEEQEYLKNIFEQEYNNIDFKLNIKRKIKYFGFYIMPNIVSDFIILKRGNVI